MSAYDFPGLLKSGTAGGAVTPEMRQVCQDKIRAANRMMGQPEENGIKFWPDFLPIVRKEMEQEGK